MMKNGKQNIEQRLTALRKEMYIEHLGAFILPSTDPHNGEYVARRWKAREYISGFDGSAGTAVITLNDAALWTDSRYFLAAEEQLSGTEYILMREKIAGTPSISEWIGRKLSHSEFTEVGIDGNVCSANMVENLRKELYDQGGLTLRTNFDPLERIWKTRPEIPLNPVELHPIEYTGETCESKLLRIRKALKQVNANGMFISSLDDIAWTLNLRGSDVHCTPLFVSHLLLENEDTTLFIDEKKIGFDVRKYLEENNIKVRKYEEVASVLAKYDQYSILMDGDETCHTLFNSVRCREKLNLTSPIPTMKAIKNEIEIAGYRRAMERDGVAMVRFLKWLKEAIRGGKETETSIDKKLFSLRAEQDLFVEPSFDTIAGYQEHGAIIHYSATPESDATLRPEGLLLLDSGGQYKDGTTDITRTIALGPITNFQKHIYTLVLKAHIQLSMAKFPQGVSGTQLDAIARHCLWYEGMNYLHGTGHGVGSYLNVHEGSHQVRMEWKPAPLVANMTLTDEPGLYFPGRFGVRTENTLLVKTYKETEFGTFLEFEPLTLCPIDTMPLDVTMLTTEERLWLNNYHHTVYERLSAFLNSDERIWLKEATKEI